MKGVDKTPGGDKMSDAEMDRILFRQDEILPSSGFAASVMEAVRREAAAPPPIPFPWKRALPFLVIAALVLAVVVVAGVAVIVQVCREPSWSQVASTPSLRTTLMPMWQGTTSTTVGWIVLALLTALVSVKVSMRLTAGRT